MVLVGVVSGLCVGKSWRMTLLAAVPLCYVMASPTNNYNQASKLNDIDIALR